MESWCSVVAAYDGRECWTAYIGKCSSAVEHAAEAAARILAQLHVN